MLKKLFLPILLVLSLLPGCGQAAKSNTPPSTTPSLSSKTYTVDEYFKTAAVTSPATIPQKSAAGTDIVYITNTGSKYHRAGCRYLSKSCMPVERSAAINKGLGPCSVCKP